MHTPGPWTALADYPINGITVGTYDAGTFTPVAHCSSRSMDVDRANATLIAAAPQMLAALLTVQRAWEDGRKLTSDEAFDVREAIAAATGQGD